MLAEPSRLSMYATVRILSGLAEQKMQRLKGVAAHGEIQDLEAEAAKTVQTIGELVAHGSEITESFSNMKAP